MGWKDIDRLELAALLHDINHFPFLHYFQEAGIEAISRARVLDIVVRHDSARQDEGGAGGTGGSLEAQLEERELSLEYLRSLLGPLADRFRAPVADQIIMSIMNSAVDADKLAYLPDDALFSGLPFGKGIDLHGILDGIDVEEVTIPGGNVTWHIVFSQEALPAVESVCFARYWNFQRLYWHHTNRAIASMIIYTIRALYSRGDASPEEYLRQTWNLGEAGALRFLENEYARLSGHEAPIHGLATNRDRIYKRVFEMTLSGAELDKAALKFQDTEAAAKNRDEAQRRIFEIVKDIVLTHSDIRRKVEPSDVVLDVPLRRMDLGGELFFRMAGGRIERGTDVSRPLHELEQNFNHMSKILRVYVAPWIRDAVARSVWEDPSRFGARVVDVLRGGQSSEVS
jgi:HD superfamily phosphohydrolase